MTTEEESHIGRTGRRRMAKGLAIIVVVMVIGAGIQLAFSDFWHAYQPGNQIPKNGQDGGAPPLTGESVEFQLKFTESSDFRTLGFNAPAGSEGSNPTLQVDVGDRVTIKLENGGFMPHSFGIVSNPDDPATILFDSAFRSASNPMKAGEKGEVTFIPNKEGEFSYICTVPGHSTLGMQGKFIVKKGEGGTAGGETVKPTGISHPFDLAFTESADFRTLGFNAPKGDPKSNPEVKIKAGDTAVINVVNSGAMPHAFGIVSDPADANTIVFNAKIKSADNPLLRGQSDKLEFVADKPGHYFYICTVPGHVDLGMIGDFIVEKP